MDDILRQIEKEKDRIHSARVERNEYLGEYKERVVLALTVSEVEEKLIYKEVEDAIIKYPVTKMIISNAINFNKAKKYILLSKKYKIMSKKVDALSFVGDIGLVLCTNDKFSDDKNRDVVIKPKLQRFLDKGLPSIYYEAQGQKIDKIYYDEIKKELPELIDDYKQLTFWDKLFGVRCPIYSKLGGEIK